ncbi:hypothetical protein PENTCL1PPCAC_19353 [Pristionchus entomophagus]|uniref:Uncharacterized protein n=1 Tax=Pristionchus entomophagus TaxID=358040 RepID=A0AAV5TSH3_9BILA|nr:hypothetical protein PENTCL1PPCAC_19353 [Pristionchus entomophagus]
MYSVYETQLKHYSLSKHVRLGELFHLAVDLISRAGIRAGPAPKTAESKAPTGGALRREGSTNPVDGVKAGFSCSGTPAAKRVGSAASATGSTGTARDATGMGVLIAGEAWMEMDACAPVTCPPGDCCAPRMAGATTAGARNACRRSRGALRETATSAKAARYRAIFSN